MKLEMSRLHNQEIAGTTSVAASLWLCVQNCDSTSFLFIVGTLSAQMFDIWNECIFLALLQLGIQEIGQPVPISLSFFTRIQEGEVFQPFKA